MQKTKEKFGICCRDLWSAFTRKKTLDVRTLQDTELKRCLGVIDLTALGIGSTLGAGIYLLVGTVAKNVSGPAVIISFLIAAFASFLAGICFAEFSARVPKAGSAYIYSYVSVGEFWAFVIGWNMILENIIGVAASGKAWSQFMDSMFNDSIRRYLEAEISIIDSSGWFDSYPDFLALGFLLVVTLFSCVGVKISSRINLIFTIVNVIVIACIIGVGFFYANINNWSQSPGGFFPFGFRGVMAGAATCFYSFVGFDTITTSGEESMNPTRHVPIAIVTTLILCLVAYLGVSSVLTLLVPWNTLAPTAALPKAFAQRGVYGTEYVIAVGGVCGLTAASLAAMYPLPRNIYSMAQDGLLFHWLGHVWKKTETPVVAACVSGTLVALAALLLDLDSLIEMMSIGTLMAYTMVAISVLVLHYQKESVGLTASHSIHGCTWSKESSQPIRERTASTSSVQQNFHQQSNTPNSCLSSLNRQGRLPSNADSTKVSMTEDTGLLRVGGEGNNKVRYVPAKTTTVIKKIKPREEADDSEVEDNAFADPPPTPTSTTSQPKSGKVSVSSQSSVVEEYRAKVRRQQEQMKMPEFNDAASNLSQPYSLKLHKGSYHPMDNSVSSLSTLSAEEPTNKSRRRVLICTTLLVIVWVTFCAYSIHGMDIMQASKPILTPSNSSAGHSYKNKFENLTDRTSTVSDKAFEWYPILILCVLALITFILGFIISRQPKNQTSLNFKTPLVPLLPLASVMINIYLMITLSDTTWIRFIVWIFLGSVIYFGYGIWHSSERRSEDQEVILYDITDQEDALRR